MQDKDAIAVITRDAIRVLHPHGSRAKDANTIVLSPTDLQKVKTAAVHVSKSEEERRMRALVTEKIEATEAAARRRTRMEELERQRTQNLVLSDIERDAKEKSNYLLARAQIQLDEEEDDIKHMNELMLYAKCVAIRDAQLQEKKMITKERKAECARMDAMMESERQVGLKRMEERERQRQQNMRKGAEVIRKQIAERRDAAILEGERRDQETKAILKAIADRAEEERTAKSTRVRMQRELMKETMKANNEAIERKRQEKQASRDEDKRLLDYLMDKERKQVEKDKEVQAYKAEREKELARLRAAQKRATDLHAEQDALRAKRAYEAHEREWRRKEKEAAERKLRDEEVLRQERAAQHAAREYAIAVESQKLKNEFFDNIERQRTVEAKIQAEQRQHHEERKKYNRDVQKQISEREMSRKKEREDFFGEGVRLSQERMDKRNKINTIKERKLAQLRDLGVPEKYWKEVERKMLLLEKPQRLQ
ncbi:hypothetical protein RI367_006303 [Sorochytrium milnesiophthora]